MNTKNLLKFRKAFFLLIGCFAFSVSYAQNLVITTEVCTSATSVRLTGPFWGWNPTGGPVATSNGNGTWTFTLSPAPTADMEYLLVVDGVQENLISAMQNGGTCAPVTDYANYANRKWLTTQPLTITNTYGQCGPCTNNGLLVNVAVCDTTPMPSSVRMTGPFWNWDPNAGPVATSNGNGTWTFNLFPVPTVDMEYLIIVDGVQENLIADVQNGGTCAPVTDYFSYANRKWTVGSGNVNINYNRCVPCEYPDLVITTEVCDSATQVNLTGPIWQWNPAFGPQAVNNGNGTWTFTISPAPTDTLEYLLVKNGVMENLVSEMVDGGGCAPLTDYSTYANRRWIIGQGAVSNTYDRCSPCALSIEETNQMDVSIYPNPTNSTFKITSTKAIGKIEIYSLVGELVYTIESNKFEVDLDISSLEAGIYTISVNGSNSNQNARIIKN
jgi:hypothetical protein